MTQIELEHRAALCGAVKNMLRAHSSPSKLMECSFSLSAVLNLICYVACVREIRLQHAQDT